MNLFYALKLICFKLKAEVLCFTAVYNKIWFTLGGTQIENLLIFNHNDNEDKLLPPAYDQR